MPSWLGPSIGVDPGSNEPNATAHPSAGAFPPAGSSPLDCDDANEQGRSDMARVGQTIEHPVTGERITFLDTAASTHGELLRMSFRMRPHGFVPSAHAHPRAEERFQLSEGRLTVRTSGRDRIVDAGEVVVVPRGTGHTWSNPFDEPATVVIELRPALRMETWFETYFGLANDGLVSQKTGLPGFLQFALLLNEYREELGAPGPAGGALRLLSAALAPVARARGYRVRYDRYVDADAP
jgi:quercetin dioxygenase-like cupin family protein